MSACAQALAGNVDGIDTVAGWRFGEVRAISRCHRGRRDKYNLTDPALLRLAPIVRGADTEHRALTPESAGLYAVATGFQAISRDDAENMARQFPVFDALYAFCQRQVAGG